MPGPALDGVGRHRHGRVRQRAVGPARRPQRCQRSWCRGPDAIPAGNVRRVRRTGAARRSPTAQPLRPDRRRVCSGPPALCQWRRGRCGHLRVRSSPTTTPRATCSRCSRWPSPTAASTAVDLSVSTSGAVARAVGAGTDRHALRLGWRDARGRLRLLGTGRRPPYAVAGVRCPASPRTSTTARRSPGGLTARTGRPRLLRRRSFLHRSRRPVRRCRRRPERHGRRAATPAPTSGPRRSRRPRRAIRRPHLRRGDQTIVRRSIVLRGSGLWSGGAARAVALFFDGAAFGTDPVGPTGRVASLLVARIAIGALER